MILVDVRDIGLFEGRARILSEGFCPACIEPLNRDHDGPLRDVAQCPVCRCGWAIDGGDRNTPTIVTRLEPRELCEPPT